MKRNRIIALLAAAAATISCNLDVVQKSTIDAASMWTEEGDFRSAMYGSFYSFRNAYRINLTYWGDFRSGVIGPGLGSFRAASHVNNTLTSSEGKGTSWATLYTCINDCNSILRHLGDITFSSQDTRDEIAANAYFIRAYCYFTIVRTWGDAPLLLTGIESDKDDIHPFRSDEMLIYARIAEDLALAETLMPASVTSCTTGSKASIHMLETDYWLWMYKVKNGGQDALRAASDAVDKVLAESRFGLLDSYADVFSHSNKGNREIIFALRFVRTTEEFTAFYNDYLIPTSKYTDDPSYMQDESVKTGSHDQWYSLSQTFQEFLYENPDDSRAVTNFAYFTVPETGNRYSWVNKFPGEWSQGVRYFTSDIPLYRFSEALLFKAEIEAAKGSGTSVPYLNRVAKRAYGKEDFYPADLRGEELNEAIFNERLKEFAVEGKSWWDYIRMGYAFIKIPSLVGRENETNILLWPISSACFEDNPNIRQTLGYN
ncbi:MAG: RagB/SusD family nutrient uptake outer membrane protein [Bacteroidales bacterium]|nr:RagB/SusD family nutrient uptake outer membrane protein [Bacteroidales bacterium]MBR0301491.1 RagB/SusD family nutrient uptake outer membrane protein [Bacteroidales bacterium]